MDEVDRLLAELKTKYKPAPEPQVSQSRPDQPQKTNDRYAPLQSLDELLLNIDHRTRRTVQATLSAQAPSRPQSRSTPSQTVSEPAAFQPLIAVPAISVQDAQQWLRQIQPTTEEGLWFEEFAHHYPSRLEAALDYLSALSSSELGNR